MTRSLFDLAQAEFRPAELPNTEKAAKLVAIRALQASRLRESRDADKRLRDARRAAAK